MCENENHIGYEQANKIVNLSLYGVYKENGVVKCTIPYQSINELMESLDLIYPESHSKCRNLTENESCVQYGQALKHIQEIKINRFKD